MILITYRNLCLPVRYYTILFIPSSVFFFFFLSPKNVDGDLFLARCPVAQRSGTMQTRRDINSRVTLRSPVHQTDRISAAQSKVRAVDCVSAAARDFGNARRECSGEARRRRSNDARRTGKSRVYIRIVLTGINYCGYCDSAVRRKTSRDVGLQERKRLRAARENYVFTRREGFPRRSTFRSNRTVDFTRDYQSRWISVQVDLPTVSGTVNGVRTT